MSPTPDPTLITCHVDESAGMDPTVPDSPTTPADLAAHIAAELEGTMPQRLDHAIVTTGYNRTDVAMRVRVQGVDLDAPDGVWVRSFDVLVREAMTW